MMSYVCFFFRLRCICFVAIVIAALASTLSAQVPAVQGTLPEDYYPPLKKILDLALKQSPQMMARNLDLAQAQANRYITDSVFWPGVSGSAGYSYSKSATVANGVSGPASVSTGLVYSFSAGQNLFQWGALKAQSDISKLAQKIAEHQWADAFRTLSSTLRTQYLLLVSKKVSLRNMRGQLAIARKNLENLEQRLKDGEISESEINAPRLSYREFELVVDRAADDYESTKTLIMRVAGCPPLSEDSIAADLVRPEYKPAVADALVNRFRAMGPADTIQGQIYVMQVKQGDLNYKIARTRLLPKFSAGTGYSLTNSQQPGSATAAPYQSFSKNFNYSVSAGWTIFDGFATRGAKLSALASRRSSERLLQNFVDSTTDAVEAARRNLDFLARALELAEIRRALAEDAVKRVTVEFQEGTVSQSIVEGTTENFNSANYTAISARMEFFNRWTEFVSMMGYDPALDDVPARYLTIKNGK